MWISRLIVLLGEYGGLLLSLLGPLVAYLLNADAKALGYGRRPLKDVWVEQWVRFRDTQKRKGWLPQIANFVITVASAAFLIPVLTRLRTEIPVLWSELTERYPYQALRVMALIVIFAVAFGLFWIRKRLPRVYAFLEISIGLWMAWDVLAFLQRPDHEVEPVTYWTDRIMSGNALRLMAAVYVIIRGLVNWTERGKDKLVPAAKTQETKG